MDRFETISSFVAVVDRKGFAPAARQLGLPPSAVTRHVAALEEHLGVRLLHRTTRSLTLTDAGARFLERARRILADLREAEDSAQSERAQPGGRLLVTAPAVFGRLHVAPLMAAFLRRYPAVVGELILSDRWLNLVEEGVDLAVRIGRLGDSSLIARRLGATRRVVVASSDYLARRGVPADPGAIAHHDIIEFRGFGAADGWAFVENGAERREPITPRFITNSADAALWHAEHGGGLAMVLGYQAAEAVRAGRLQIVLSAYEPPPLPIQAVYASTRLLSAKVRAFIEMASGDHDWHFDRPELYKPA